jgi:glycosyltransferase involved in cell wall biosynthesis
MAHRPEIVVIPGWLVPAYTKLAQSEELASVRLVMGMDTPWRGGARQHLARLWIGGYLRRMDRIVVPGERAWQYAVRLGVPETKIRRGLYGIDFEAFSSVYERRTDGGRNWPRQFLYVGRYVDVKGIDVLLEAYRRYRAQVREAWPLVCCGQGPLASQIAATEGVVDLGFQQPGQLMEIYAQSGVFVIASRHDPWPLVLVEACGSGLPVIHSEACGSAVEAVRSYYNGLHVATQNAEDLGRAMRWMHEHYEQLPEMGRRGQELARPFSAQMWALRWSEMFKELGA